MASHVVIGVSIRILFFFLVTVFLLKTTASLQAAGPTQLRTDSTSGNLPDSEDIPRRHQAIDHAPKTRALLLAFWAKLRIHEDVFLHQNDNSQTRTSQHHTPPCVLTLDN